MALSALFAMAPQNQKPSPDDFTITSDKTENGIRTIAAVPSRIVCSRIIVVKVNTDGNIIEDVDYTGGCPGNLKAIKVLTKGLTVEQAIEKLDGIECGNRPTSCTDQLARILKKAYEKKQ